MQKKNMYSPQNGGSSIVVAVHLYTCTVYSCKAVQLYRDTHAAGAARAWGIDYSVSSALALETGVSSCAEG